jgi:hypothetical protein
LWLVNRCYSAAPSTQKQTQLQQVFFRQEVGLFNLRHLAATIPTKQPCFRCRTQSEKPTISNNVTPVPRASAKRNRRKAAEEDLEDEAEQDDQQDFVEPDDDDDDDDAAATPKAKPSAKKPRSAAARRRKVPVDVSFALLERSLFCDDGLCDLHLFSLLASRIVKRQRCTKL